MTVLVRTLPPPPLQHVAAYEGILQAAKGTPNEKKLAAGFITRYTPHPSHLHHPLTHPLHNHPLPPSLLPSLSGSIMSSQHWQRVLWTLYGTWGRRRTTR